MIAFDSLLDIGFCEKSCCLEKGIGYERKEAGSDLCIVCIIHVVMLPIPRAVL